MQTAFALLYPATAEAAASFNNLDGSTSQPITMRQTSKMAYTETNEYQAVSMDYVGNKLAMLIVSPKARGDFLEFTDKFDQIAFRTALNGLRTAEVNISLPKFEKVHIGPG